jgi:uncharacterized pyridoxamine 5'-phosphate oxidase family protein
MDIEGICYNNEKSSYTQHILNKEHTYSSLENNLDIVNIQLKGQYVNTLDRYYIYKTKKSTLSLIYYAIYNPIFEFLT